jgi:hypothetical protein
VFVSLRNAQLPFKGSWINSSATQRGAPECPNVDQKQQRCHTRCEEVYTCILEVMQLDRGVQSEAFGEG